MSTVLFILCIIVAMICGIAGICLLFDAFNE